jgi:hypothetical protein
MVMTILNRSYSLLLPRSLYDCPDYWRNYINHVNPNHRTSNAELMVDQLFKIYHAKLIEYIINMSCGAEVIFDSKEDFIFFKLQWS